MPRKKAAPLKIRVQFERKDEVDLNQLKGIASIVKNEDDSGYYSYNLTGYALKSDSNTENKTAQVLRKLRRIEPEQDEYKIYQPDRKQNPHFSANLPIYIDTETGPSVPNATPTATTGSSNKTEVTATDDTSENEYFFDTKKFYRSEQEPNVYFIRSNNRKARQTVIYQLGTDHQLRHFIVDSKKGGSGGFGHARSDLPEGYVWYGNQALGYALNLDMSKYRKESVPPPQPLFSGKDKQGKAYFITIDSKKYFKANTPEDLTSLVRIPIADTQKSEITYFKEEVKGTLKETPPNSKNYDRVINGSERRLYDLAPGIPKPTVLPDRTTRQLSFPSEPMRVPTPLNMPKKPSDLFKQQPYLERYKSSTKEETVVPTTAEVKTKIEDLYTLEPQEDVNIAEPVKSIRGFKEAFRKKARLVQVIDATTKREDTATMVWRAVEQQYEDTLFNFVKEWRIERKQTSTTKTLPATAYCEYLLRQTNFSSVKQEWNSKGLSSTPLDSTMITAQEWCHLHGHAEGGPDEYYNFVSGSHYANTEQLAIESAIKWARDRVNLARNDDRLKISVTAYRLPDTDIAVWIRFKIYYKAEKIFDHVFDGQSEQFDICEYKILESTVQRVLCQAFQKDPDFKEPNMVAEYERVINAKIEKRNALAKTKEDITYYVPLAVTKVGTSPSSNEDEVKTIIENKG